MREFNLNAKGPREMPRESFINSKRPPRKTANRSNNCRNSATAKRIRRYGIQQRHYELLQMRVVTLGCLIWLSVDLTCDVPASSTISAPRSER